MVLRDTRQANSKRLDPQTMLKFESGQLDTLMRLLLPIEMELEYLSHRPEEVLVL